MKIRIQFLVVIVAFALAGAAMAAEAALAQKPAQELPKNQEVPNNQRRERTIDEIKVEAVRRAEVGQYPLIVPFASQVAEWKQE